MAEETRRLAWIDALRGWAILGVVFVHTRQYGLEEEGLPGLFKFIVHQGGKGVQLFYLLSAFTMYYTYIRHSRREKFYEGNFFIRRFFRIAPLYYLAIAYYLWQDGFGPRPWLGEDKFISLSNIISNFLFVSGVHPYWINSLVPGGWSIAVEMSFYLLVPFLIIYVNSKAKGLALLTYTLIIYLVLSVIFLKFPMIPNYELWVNYLVFYLPSQMPVFALGIILYFAVFTEDAVKREERKGALLYGSLAAVIAAAIYFATGWKMLPHIAISLFFFALIYICSRFKLPLIENKITIFIGKLSYTLYLVHHAPLDQLNKLHLLDFIGIGSPLQAVCNFLLRY
ncbi:MAG TPA: acyltransferase, partial [Ignavibacteriales bacterium]|nr:acyltransferase [Ignavibacteriales bacterium]